MAANGVMRHGGAAAAVAFALAALLVAACSSEPSPLPAAPEPQAAPTPAAPATPLPAAPGVLATPGVAQSSVPGAYDSAAAIPLATPTPAIATDAPAPLPAPALLPAQVTTIPSPSDPVALARRFRPGGDVGMVSPPSYSASDVGRREAFWLVDLIRLEVERVEATLRWVTPETAWFTTAGAHDLADRTPELAARFVRDVRPAIIEAVYGAGGQLRGAAAAQTTFLIAPLSGAAGFFAPSDLYTGGVFPYSNERPMLYLDARVVRHGGFASLAAHEFHHLLHHAADGGEHTWVSEGLAEEAASRVVEQGRLRAAGSVSLTNWPSHGEGLGPNYAAAHLFFAYVAQRYGADALAAIAQRPERGAAGVDAYLRSAERVDTFAGVFRDWATANVLGGAAPLPFGYAAPAVMTPVTPRVRLSAAAPLGGSVAPFAVDYARIDVPPGGATLRFDGDASAAVIAAAPPDGGACWWSNRGDAAHTRLTREIDLSGAAAATLQFRLWHNLEERWDYLYVAASGDGGTTWRVLEGAGTVADDRLGTAYGPGYTGASGGWVQERVDLSAFAGGRVLLAFEQVTDAAINLDGACIDDIAVPEVGFYDDAETDNGWRAEGFVRTNNAVAQRFFVRVVSVGGGAPPQVVDITLDGANRGALRLPPTAPGARVTALVMSVTPATRQPARYTLSLTAP